MLSPQELIHYAQQAGFKVIQSENITSRIRGSVLPIYRRAQFFSPLVQFAQHIKLPLFEKWGITSPEAVWFAQTCLAQKKVFESGAMVYYAHVLEKPKVT